MKWRARSWALFLALAVAGAFSLPRFTAIPAAGRPGGSFFFQVALSTPDNGFTQVYYDLGRRFNEQDSSRQDILPGPSARVYRLPIPYGICHGIRFDPINHRGTAAFRDAAIVDADGGVVHQFLPETFLAAYGRNATHNIATLAVRDGALAMRTEVAGDDPYVVFELERPLVLGPGIVSRIGAALPVFAVVFLAIFGTAGLLPERAAGWLSNRNAGAMMVAGGAALVAFKIWLVAAQPVYAIADAGHDDQLFVRQAAYLLSGEWLGPYSQFTLMKGPMYPIFIAIVFLLGVPLFIAQHLLYAGACWLMTRALRPLVRRRWIRAVLFVVLLFNPITFDGARTMRVARQDILPALVLVIASGLIGFYARCDGPRRRLVPWVLLAGAALPMFWLTREEGIWIAPCAGLLWIAAAARVWRRRDPDRAARLALLSSPLLIWAAAVAGVAAINWRYYGVFTTCEFKQAQFREAYGSLSRVTPAHWRPYIVMPRETRERIYAVSPAFAELRPYLEGAVGESWAAVSEGVTHLPAAEREIGGGMFMWALRDAVVDAGHGGSGADAMAYYGRLAREVNTACDRGLIAAGPRRSGFLPPLRREQVAPVLASARRAVEFLFFFNDMGASVPPSQGAPENRLLFSDITRGRLSPTIDGPHLPPRQKWLDRERMGVLDEIALVYSWIAPWAIGGGGAALVAAIGIGAARRRIPYFGIVAVAVLGSAAALVAIVSLIDGTSFPAVDVYYLVGCYAPVLLGALCGWIALGESLDLVDLDRRDARPAVRP